MKSAILSAADCRKRTGDKKRSEGKRKRLTEPRPHPPDCLNKRYWDDVRAGRVPDQVWASPNGLKSSRRRRQQDNSLDSRFVLTSRCPSAGSNPNNGIPFIQMPDGACVSPSSLSHKTYHPFMSIFNTYQPVQNDFNFLLEKSFDSLFPCNYSHHPATTPASTTAPKPSTSIPHPSSDHAKNPAESAIANSKSDDEVDQIANDIFTKKVGVQKRDNSLCIIPIPVPIPIFLPLSADFIIKHYGPR